MFKLILARAGKALEEVLDAALARWAERHGIELNPPPAAVADRPDEKKGAKAK
jgi:hypothetical protein